MTPPAVSETPVVFLLDVDNTLLDNDGITADLRRTLVREVGADGAERYFEILEQLRTERGYVDYLGALQRYRETHPRDQRLLDVSSFLLDYPFDRSVFPGVRDVIEHLAAFGPTVILSDGDAVFQPRKIERSGLRAAVGGRVLVYIHKELELQDVERRFPARHYVLVDDKVRILTAVKEVWGERVTTVFPRQGHYAREAQEITYPPPDVTVERIAELREIDLPLLLSAARRIGEA
jgi:hypothetical protein